MRVKALFYWWAIAFTVSLATGSGATRADDAPGAKLEVDAAATKVEVNANVLSAPAKSRGRLPAYFSKVVNEAQRAKIYSIQAAYAERAAQLEKELTELKTSRDAEIRAVLTPTQRQKLDGLIAAARAKKGAAPAVDPPPPAAEDKVAGDAPPAK